MNRDGVPLLPIRPRILQARERARFVACCLPGELFGLTMIRVVGGRSGQRRDLKRQRAESVPGLRSGLDEGDDQRGESQAGHQAGDDQGQRVVSSIELGFQASELLPVLP